MLHVFSSIPDWLAFVILVVIGLLGFAVIEGRKVRLRFFARGFGFTASVK